MHNPLPCYYNRQEKVNQESYPDLNMEKEKEAIDMYRVKPGPVNIPLSMV